MKNGFAKDRINILLSGSVLFLLIIYLLSFVFSDKEISKKTLVSTSLMNPKYMAETDYLELSAGEETLVIIRKNGIWFCGKSEGGNSFYVPCRSEKIEEFLSQLSSRKNLEKIMVKNNQLSDFGLDEENRFYVSYYADSRALGISFGDSDFSDSGRYVKSSENDDVYLADKSFDKFLYISLNQWSDPYLVSKNLGKEYKESDVMTSGFDGILELRHGGISTYIPDENSLPDKKIKLEMGDTSSFTFSFYKIPSQNDFHVSVEYKNPFGKNMDSITYGVKISEWTYKKIFSDEK